MVDASVGMGLSGGSSSARKRPLRSRSARTTALMAVGPSAASPAKGTIATGVRFSVAPVISIWSCARAEAARTSPTAHSQSERKATRRIPVVLLVGVTGLIFRPEGKFKLAVERHPRGRRRQRRGCQDRTPPRLIVRRVSARLKELEPPFDHLAGGQLQDLESALGIALQIRRQNPSLAHGGADAIHVLGKRLVARGLGELAGGLFRVRLAARLVDLAALLVELSLLHSPLLAQQQLLEIVFRRGLRLGFGLRLGRRRLLYDLGLLHLGLGLDLRRRRRRRLDLWRRRLGR